ncbi:hypothetical protein ABZ412_19685 [Nocardia sp. NPDC005746]|uniref:hypothetical protein n=1 Tax=Nocardia sp. NPDC005746 TaxID=3157062 RepID=UPI0033CB9C9E
MAGDAMSGLKDDGRNGVVFDHDAATTMAQQCASMLTIVEAAIRAVEPAKKMKALSQKSDNDSGHQLAQKFDRAATNLVETVLKDHRDILTEMGEAFVAAGKLYIGTDEASRDAINSGKFTDQQLSGAFKDFRSGGGQPGLAEPNIPVASLDMPGWKQSSWNQEWNFFSDSTDGYSWSGTAKKDYGNTLADTTQMKRLMNELVTQSGVVIDDYKINPETSEMYASWNDFYHHWKYIDENKVPAQLETFAQAWHKAQIYLRVQAQTFESATQKYLQPFQGQTSDIDKIWASPAAVKAKEAITKYLASTQNLVTSMDVMAVNLADTQGWVKRLQNFLPSKSFEDAFPSGKPLLQSEVDSFVKDMKRAWDAWYVVGVGNSSKAIPIMPNPKSTMEIKPTEVKIPTDQPNPTTQQPSYTPTTQTPSTETPKPVDDKQPTNTDPKDTNPKKTDTPTTTDTTLQTLITQASTAIQAGITAAEQGVEKIAAAVGTALTQAQITTKTTDPTSQLTQQLQNMGLIPKTDTPSGGPTGGSPSGTPTSPGSPQTPKTQLSPRSSNPASTTETDTDEVAKSRAGLASTSSTSSSGTGATGGMGGSPMAAGSQGQGKEHKRPQFLTNLENLEDVLGEAPAAVTPVAER